MEKYASEYECPEDTPLAIADALEKLNKKWKAGKLARPRLHPDIHERFDRRALARKLAEQFDKLVKR